ncbi:MAG: hypothetical protein WD154_03940 [Nitrosopumilaceae archaeon]
MSLEGTLTKIQIIFSFGMLVAAIFFSAFLTFVVTGSEAAITSGFGQEDQTLFKFGKSLRESGVQFLIYAVITIGATIWGSITVIDYVVKKSKKKTTSRFFQTIQNPQTLLLIMALIAGR